MTSNKDKTATEKEKEIGTSDSAVVGIPKETLDFFSGDEIRARVFYEKYALRDEKGNMIEKLPSEMWSRIANELANVETEDAKKREWREKFLWLLEDFRFVPGGRIMFGAGAKKRATLLNCYVLPVKEDTLESIFDWCKEAARTYSLGGGVGTDISILRPRGARVNNAAIFSSGAVSFMEIMSETTHTIGQNGRRGALMITINVDHPDVMEFISVKQNLKKVRYANISIKLTDEFMKAVEKDADFTLKFNSKPTGKIEKKVKAREVWNSLIKSARNWAEPGLIFWDTVKKYSPSEYNGMEVLTTNPCSEQPLQPYGACDLGSLNLSAFVMDPFTDNARLDWASLEKAARYAMRFLDNVLDYNSDKHPLKAQAEAVGKSRRTGLGVTGLGDMLAKLKIKYDSEEAIRFIDKLFETIKNSAYDESAEIAKEKGSFPLFDKKKHLSMPFIKALNEDLQKKIAANGLRNVALLTVPPVGSGSVLAGTSSGIEPIFAFSYTRRSESLSKEYFKVYHPLVLEYMKVASLNDDAKLPDFFVPAHMIKPEFRVRLQGTVQKHIDSAISSTVNLPENTGVEQVGDIYMKAWKAGCFMKGNDIYTANGLKDISEVNIDDKVLSHDGLYHKVTEVYHLPAETRRFIKLDIQGNEDLISTSEHPILVLRPTAVHWEKKAWEEQKHEPIWIKISEAMPGDHVVLPKFKLGGQRIKEIAIAEYVNGAIIRDGMVYPKRSLPWKRSKEVIAAKSHGIKNIIPVDKDFVWFIGWFVAEGHYSAGSYVRMTLDTKETIIADRLEKIVLEKFGIECDKREIITSGGGSSLRIQWGSKMLSEFLQASVGRGSYNKHFPGWFTQISPELLETMINAWIAGDGGVTVSKRLSREAFMIQAVLKQTYALTASRKNGLYSLRQASQNYMGKTWKNYMCYRIRSIADFYYNAPVYNFAVEDTDSYVVNGIVVHNCKGITVYREGSREGVLITDEEVAKKETAATNSNAEWKRIQVMTGKTIHLKMQQGSLYVTINVDEGGKIREVFVNMGHSGSQEKSYTEAIGRLISRYVQLNGDVKSVIASLKGIKANDSISWDRGIKIYSIPDAIAKALEIAIGEVSFKATPLSEQGSTGGTKAVKPSFCPECKEPMLVYENGCDACKNCGYTKCS